MKELVFEGDFNASLLAEELFDAFPEWKYERKFNFGLRDATDVIITNEPGIFTIRGPSEILDEKKISAIVDKHDPSKLSKSEKNEKDKQDKKDSIRKKLKEETSLTDDEIDLLTYNI